MPISTKTPVTSRNVVSSRNVVASRSVISQRIFTPDTLLRTGQATAYHVGDDGDHEKGLAKSYTIFTTGGYSGTVNLDVPHYASNGLAFAATTPGTITDSGNGLATFLTGDVIIIRGSAGHDGAYNVSTGGVAGTIRTTEATTLEAAGAYISIAKRTTHSNNAVLDMNTGLMFARYTSSAEKVGIASDGKLNWYDAATCFTLHAAAADLQMVAGAAPILRIVGGAGEVAVYNVGDVIVCSGFVDADNNLPGWVLQSVTVNGADLDLVLGPTHSNLLADISSEAAGGSRDIKLVCRNVFGYCAAANAANAGVGLANLTDWRIPNDIELASLRNMEAATAVPDTTAFPGWSTATYYWSSTTQPINTSYAMNVIFANGYVRDNTKTTTYFASLVRSGV